MDPVGVALCGLGIALAAVGEHGRLGSGLGLQDAVLLGAALYGVHRILRSRAPLWLIGALVVAWGLEHFWTLVPTGLVKSSYQLSADHPTLYATPAFLAHVAMTGVFVAIVVLGRARIGLGLVTATLAALGIMLLAELALLATDKDSSANIVLEATAHGWAFVWTGLTVASWFALAVGPVAAASPPRALGTSIAVVGAALLCAVIAGTPQHVGGGHDVAIVFIAGAMALGWVLCAVGLGGLARAGAGAAGWVGMGLSIFQVLVLPLGLALGDSAHEVASGLGLVLSFGFLGLGMAAISAPSLGLGNLRAVAGALFFGAVFGSSLAAVAAFASAKRILHIQEPFWALETFMRPGALMGLVVWAASLAYVVRPPPVPAEG